MTFQVGDRVEVDLKEVPENERNCIVGTITKIWLKFARTPKFRRKMITVHFDENYIKKGDQLCGGIDDISLEDQSKIEKIGSIYEKTKRTYQQKKNKRSTGD